MSRPLSIRIVPYAGAEYQAAVGLRRAVLRTPLGLDFTAEQLAAESDDTHFAAFDGEAIVGAVVMTPYDPGTVKLRQMAVSPDAQGRGVGARLVKAFETYAALRGISKIVLAARCTAQAFYVRNGYGADGDVYEEVTIPHIRMSKALAPLSIAAFAPADQAAIIDLILPIQRDEFGVDISAADQPDLMAIPTFYQTGTGGFWVARKDGDIIGTIALKDIGNAQVALRKMFVAAGARGGSPNIAGALLAHAVDHARAGGVREIILGTTEAFKAAHRFYENNGFAAIAAEHLPAAFPRMSQDTRFYRLRLA